MARFVTAGGGFLLAVLWFDLMHDVQVVGHRGAELPEAVVESIARYYRRVTTDARPMNRLVALAMMATLAAVIVEIAGSDVRSWVAWASLALVIAPVSLAGAHTVKAAVRLGGRADTIAEQSALARSIFRDHVFCLAAIAALMALQLAFAS